MGTTEVWAKAGTGVKCQERSFVEFAANDGFEPILAGSAHLADVCYLEDYPKYLSLFVIALRAKLGNGARFAG